METFEIYKFLHVTTAIIWVGGGVFGAILTERAKTASPAHRLGIATDMAHVSNRVFAPTAVLTLVFGVLMVIDAEAIEFEQTWIVIGLTAIALSIVIGAGYLGPQSGKLVAELEEGSEAALDRLRRIALAGYADLVILLIAVWAMVAKPGLG
jgi:uncharacterized membrane protein